MKKAAPQKVLVPHELAGSPQDATLKGQFLHVVAGATRDHGPHVAEMVGAYVARMQRETGWSFTGCVVRLIEQHAHENGY